MHSLYHPNVSPAQQCSSLSPNLLLHCMYRNFWFQYCNLTTQKFLLYPCLRLAYYRNLFGILTNEETSVSASNLYIIIIIMLIDCKMFYVIEFTFAWAPRVHWPYNKQSKKHECKRQFTNVGSLWLGYPNRLHVAPYHHGIIML